ncbi:MAG: FMN-binding protein, partial [Lachnospiraceae bacterium]|nr:FMN-binding protein [Lachnospiraceae bacterium]
MKNIIKDAMILFAITAVAGVLLAVVNEVTKAPIAAQKQAAIEAACREVFSEAESFTEEKAPSEYPEYAAFAAAYPKDSIDRIYTAKDASGKVLGLVLNVTNKEGYGGSIRFSLGVALDGTVTGVSILETGETPGLGLRADTELVPQFAGKKAERFEYVKGGGAAAENQV